MCVLGCWDHSGHQFHLVLEAVNEYSTYTSPPGCRRTDIRSDIDASANRRFKELTDFKRGPPPSKDFYPPIPGFPRGGRGGQIPVHE